MSESAYFSKVSVVITYDPRPGTMEEFFNRLSEHSRSKPYTIDLLIVDSLGALDNYRRATMEMELDHLNTKILSPGHDNRDQLQAILWALPRTSGDAVLVIDPDMHDNINDISLFLLKLQCGLDVIYGRRIKRKGTPAWRRALSFIYNLTTRVITKIPVNDFNSPMILLSNRAVKAIEEANKNSPSPRLYMLEKMINSIAEIKITTSNNNGKNSNYSFCLLIRTGIRRQTEVLKYVISKHKRNIINE